MRARGTNRTFTAACLHPDPSLLLSADYYLFSYAITNRFRLNRIRAPNGSTETLPYQLRVPLVPGRCRTPHRSQAAALVLPRITENRGGETGWKRRENA